MEGFFLTEPRLHCPEHSPKRDSLRASLSVGHCAIAIWPYFLAMAKSISISQFLCYICKSSCSPPSEGPYLSDDSQSTFEYR